MRLRGVVRWGDASNRLRPGGTLGILRRFRGRRFRRAAGRRQRDAAGRRLIRQRAGHALGSGALTAGLLRSLFAADDLAVGFVLLARFFRRRHIHLGHDLCAHAARSDERSQQCLDTLDVIVFQAVHEIELLLAQREFIVALGRGQQATLLIDHRDLAGFHVRNARGDEIHDGLNLLLLQAVALLQLHEHRGARGMMIPDERGLSGHCEMHPRALHWAQVCDGSPELGFECVLIARVLDKLADPKSGILVHGSETAAAFGQPLAGQLQTGVADALCRHLDGVRSGLDPVRNLGRIQRLGDRRLILGGKVAVEQAVARAARPEHDRDTGSDGCRDAHQQEERLQACGEARRRRHCCDF